MYKIKARSAWDSVEIWPFDTIEGAKNCIDHHNNYVDEYKKKSIYGYWIQERWSYDLIISI